LISGKEARRERGGGEADTGHSQAFIPGDVDAYPFSCREFSVVPKFGIPGEIAIFDTLKHCNHRSSSKLTAGIALISRLFDKSCETANVRVKIIRQLHRPNLQIAIAIALELASCNRL